MPSTLSDLKKNDNGERKKVAGIWSKQYNTEIKAEDVNCDGCFSEGKRLFSTAKSVK